ncbi:3427_t:CDS:1, partial [Scutellospora calospora]
INSFAIYRMRYETTSHIDLRLNLKSSIDTKVREIKARVNVTQGSGEPIR